MSEFFNIFSRIFLVCSSAAVSGISSHDFRPPGLCTYSIFDFLILSEYINLDHFAEILESFPQNSETGKTLSQRIY